MKQFCEVQNSFPTTEKLTKINYKTNAKTIATLDISTHLIAVLDEIISFVFNYKKKYKLDFLNHQFNGNPKELTIVGVEVLLMTQLFG